MDYLLMFLLIILFAVVISLWSFIKCGRLLRRLQRINQVAIDIEDIKALDPGKIYAVSLDLTHMEAANDIAECLKEIGKEHNIKFILFAKGFAEFVSAPEGIEINLTGMEAFQCMQEEMLAYLEKTYDKDDAPPEVMLVFELERIFLANRDYGAKHCKAFSNPNDWPKEVTGDQLLSIVQKWEMNLSKVNRRNDG